MVKKVIIFGAFASLLCLTDAHHSVRAHVELYSEPKCTSPRIAEREHIKEGHCKDIDHPFWSFAAFPRHWKGDTYKSHCSITTYRSHGCAGDAMEVYELATRSGKCNPASPLSDQAASSVKLDCGKKKKHHKEKKPEKEKPKKEKENNEKPKKEKENKHHDSSDHHDDDKHDDPNVHVHHHKHKHIGVLPSSDHKSNWDKSCHTNPGCNCKPGPHRTCPPCDPFVCGAFTSTTSWCDPTVIATAVISSKTVPACFTKEIVVTPTKAEYICYDEACSRTYGGIVNGNKRGEVPAEPTPSQAPVIRAPPLSPAQPTPIPIHHPSEVVFVVKTDLETIKKLNKVQVAHEKPHAKV
ncbi:hypothetical protein P152DRAFT_473631 [Eremomyces bilateralis CBS 781.70]|uniref:Secreted protein n=1 Tax=Eremomyces bilateralis CBS 781.70 TaxID=1392243 RepID=A0A6G1G368_9PEZI|nr:uncharacterized protein P152DRAFT_473631 [Eremomyces bilateralis CBS 781.70]KAF1812458.1 hypothetical protein P152DRAFT_473631 [Eremomyces bilateralis CBS 781.70]